MTKRAPMPRFANIRMGIEISRKDKFRLIVPWLAFTALCTGTFWAVYTMTQVFDILGGGYAG